MMSDILLLYLAYCSATLIISVFYAWQDASKFELDVEANFMFASYDFWIGSFHDRDEMRTYWFPIPMLGIRFQVKDPHA